MGIQEFTFSAGDSLLITANVPTFSKITRASLAALYYSLVLDFAPAGIADLAVEMKAVLVETDTCAPLSMTWKPATISH